MAETLLKSFKVVCVCVCGWMDKAWNGGFNEAKEVFLWKCWSELDGKVVGE